MCCIYSSHFSILTFLVSKMLLHFSHVTFSFLERLLCLMGLLFPLLFAVAIPFSLAFFASTQKLEKNGIEVLISPYVHTDRNSDIIQHILTNTKSAECIIPMALFTHDVKKMFIFKRSNLPLNIGLNFVTCERSSITERKFYNIDVYPESNFQSNLDKTNEFLVGYVFRDLSNLFLQPIPLKVLLRHRNCFQFLPLQFDSRQEYL